mmetsp:Transcript_23327/g.59971  ORF Transcript_23327/g.59971 Transcript_23327/m.59971 type:complete len:269 (+) Transcript_23327:313-1119(+)
MPRRRARLLACSAFWTPSPRPCALIEYDHDRFSPGGGCAYAASSCCESSPVLRPLPAAVRARAESDWWGPNRPGAAPPVRAKCDHSSMPPSNPLAIGGVPAATAPGSSIAQASSITPSHRKAGLRDSRCTFSMSAMAWRTLAMSYSRRSLVFAMPVTSAPPSAASWLTASELPPQSMRAATSRQRCCSVGCRPRVARRRRMKRRESRASDLAAALPPSTSTSPSRASRSTVASSTASFLRSGPTPCQMNLFFSRRMTTSIDSRTFTTS